MNEGYKPWQGFLMGTFHSSPNKLPTTLTNITATNPEVTTIWFQHPHLHRGMPKSIAVRANPVEVFEWLSTFQHVSMPSALTMRIRSADGAIQEALSWLAQGEGRRVGKSWRIDPWYFFVLVDGTGPTKQSKVKVEDAVIFSQLFNPDSFKFLDHKKVRETLLHLAPTVLAKIWLAKPDYFSILSETDAETWKTLHARAVEGLYD